MLTGVVKWFDSEKGGMASSLWMMEKIYLYIIQLLIVKVIKHCFKVKELALRLQTAIVAYKLKMSQL